MQTSASPSSAPSAGTPSRERNVAAVAITLDGSVLLFDCGEGTQHQLLRAPVRSGAIDAIFLTHLHGDHVYGLPGLLASMSMNGRTRPLELIGPEGTLEYLRGHAADDESQSDASRSAFPRRRIAARDSRSSPRRSSTA